MKRIPALLPAALLAGCVMSGEAAGKGAGTAVLTFRAFDGGGFTFDAEIDPPVASCACRKRYASLFHGSEKGAPWDMVCTVTGLAPGEGTLTVRQRSPIAGNHDRIYAVTVDAERRVRLRHLETRDLGLRPGEQPR